MPAEEKINPALLRNFVLAGGILILIFIVPLWRLLRFSVGNDFYSYIPLIPFITGYLIWTKKKNLPREFSPARLRAIIFFAIGAALALWFWFDFRAASAQMENQLFLTTLSFLFFITALGFWILGGKMMRAIVFPFALLIFMVPWPVFILEHVETALQYGSAAAADWMFNLTGLPFLREGLFFHLPDITLQVAPECSGIHSSLVLLITSLVAGYLFFQTAWRRAALAIFVIPLAILRNGFRIFVIGQLCVHIGPQMIDSPIHHRGGPLFFILSLIPFFLLLYFLRKSEQRKISPVLIP